MDDGRRSSLSLCRDVCYATYLSHRSKRPENLSTTEGRAHASVTRRCAGAPGGGGRMPSAPMTAQRQRTIGFWLVRFPCCGKRFPNQTQAVRHLVQAHGYDPTAAAQDVTRVVRADRTRA